MNKIFDSLRDTSKTLKQLEDSAAEELGLKRTMSEALKEFVGLLAGELGLTESLMRMLSASARSLAAAEANFAASVEAREAIDALIADIAG